MHAPAPAAQIRQGRAGRGRRSSLAGARLARVAVLPERNDHICAEHQAHGTGGEPVEAVGEVDRVRPRAHQQVAERHEYDGAHRDRRDVAHIGQVLAAGGEVVRTAELQRENAERHRRDELSDEFRRLVQPQVALLADLDEVVEEPDAAERRRETEHEESRRRRSVRVVPDADHVRTPVARPQSGEDGDATHRRRAALRLVTRRTFDADLLAEP